MTQTGGKQSRVLASSPENALRIALSIILADLDPWISNFYA